MGKGLKLGLAAGLLALAAPLSAQDVQSGIRAWQAGEYSKAVAIWEPLAQQGNADAQFNLGQAYRLGRGVVPNLAKAQGLFEQAARQGHLDAETNLGLLLFNNGNRVSAMRWLQSAALKGEPRALLVYGTALFNGEGVERDPVRAYAYVSRAAAQGLGPAKSTLAEMDALLPIEVRQQGVELAQQLAAADQTAKPAPKPSAPPPTRVAENKPAPPKPQPTTSPAAKPVPAPAAKPAPAKAAPAVTSQGGWRVQLGAFSQRASADALGKKLQGNAALSGAQIYLIPAGKVTRLQMGPFASQAAANAVCNKLKPSGQACFPVKAN